MLPEGIFIVKFNTRPEKFKTFVTRCCLMVPDAIFIVKHPTSKRYENFIQVSITFGSCQIVDIKQTQDYTLPMSYLAFRRTCGTQHKNFQVTTSGI